MSNFRPVLYFMFKKDLAKKYGVTARTLRNWIIRNTPLYDTLLYYGYSPYDKVLTPKQMEVIFDYVGKPDEYYDIDEHKKVFLPPMRYSKQELLDIYRTTPPTFIRILERIPELKDIREIYLTDTYLNIDEVKMLFEYLGHPFWLDKS